MPSFDTQKIARQTLSLFFLFLLIAMFRPGSAFAQAGVAGSVTSVSGTVQLQRAGATIPVTQGMLVQVGDRLVTGDDGHVMVLLTDQSTLDLGDSANMVMTAHAGAATRVDLFGGVVRSFVNRTIGAAAPNFEVHTPNAVAAARGTLYDTSYIANVSRPTFGDAHNFTDVSVYDGMVNVANLNNLAGGTNVPAGYESTVAGSMNATSPGPLGMTGAVSFHTGQRSSSGTGLAVGTTLSPVSTVPPPSCPVCMMGSSTSTGVH
ncbi:MAG: FecR domain-containing protein [Candidatus Binataceae bacterium]